MEAEVGEVEGVSGDISMNFEHIFPVVYCGDSIIVTGSGFVGHLFRRRNEKVTADMVQLGECKATWV